MINFVNPYKIITGGPKEMHEAYRYTKLQSQAFEEYEKYKTIADEDSSIKEQCRKIDILIKNADDHDMYMKLMLRKQKLKIDKISELIMKDFDKALSEDDLDKAIMLYFAVLEMSNRINL